MAAIAIKRIYDAPAELARRYRERRGRGRNVTLLYAAKDPACSHASVLKEWLDEKVIGDVSAAN